jgi:hypothetical protein
LIWAVRDGELTVTTRRAQLRKAQATFRQFVSAGAPSLAEEPIAERPWTQAEHNNFPWPEIMENTAAASVERAQAAIKTAAKVMPPGTLWRIERAQDVPSPR